MHIIYFHQYFSTPAGSTGTRSYEIARALVKRGPQVTMVCGSGGHIKVDGLERVRDGELRGTVAGIDVIQFDLPYSNRDGFIKRSITFFRFAWRCVGVVFKAKYDLIFATSTPLTASIPGIVAKLTMRGKPFVFEVRDLWPELPKAMGVIRNPIVLAAMSVLEFVSYRCADACVGLAPGIVEGIRKRGAKSLRVEMIPNSCDLSLFRPELKPDPIDGVNDSDFVAVFTGAHGLANGLGSVLDMAAKLLELGREDIKIVLIGDGSQKDGLMQRAESEGLRNCVFADPIPKARLPFSMARANVGMMVLENVSAFYNGTSPNKFFDYISSGMPVVVNYPGWVARMRLRLQIR
jgi:glycosyltransferase involved in cell wall biosynthesis